MTQEKAAPKDFLGIRTKREALGMTLKDVFALTRISVVNLEAIENGEFQDLPVPIYTKNFIKTYAQALDLDSKPILDSYEAYLNSQQIAQTQIPEAVPEQEPFIKTPIHYKAYIAAASIIIIIAVVIFAISQQQQPVPKTPAKPPEIVAAAQPAAVSTTVQTTQTPQPTEPKTVVQPVKAETSKQVRVLPALPGKQSVALLKSAPKQNAPVIETTAPVANSEATDILVIKATEETWLRIKIDQKPPFQVLLKPGEEIKHKGAGFDVDVGNAGGVTMHFKGKVIENLGKSGDVIHLRLP
ncbi:MAG: RodZ domain-containing protein [Smithellaceae bacterium]